MGWLLVSKRTLFVAVVLRMKAVRMPRLVQRLSRLTWSSKAFSATVIEKKIATRELEKVLTSVAGIGGKRCLRKKGTSTGFVRLDHIDEDDNVSVDLD